MIIFKLLAKAFHPKILLILVPVLIAGAVYYGYQNYEAQQQQSAQTKAELAKVQTNLTTLQNTDQIKKNKELQDEITQIHSTFSSTASQYETLVDFKKNNKTDKQDQEFAQVLNYLANKNYSSASAVLKDIDTQIKDAQAKAAAAVVIPANVPVSNTPPGSGFSRQTVEAAGGSYLVQLVAADLNSTKVIVDTASDGDCANNCSVMPLADYVSRNGAYAGINGSFFCPADYPSCANKVNSFDTLLMNKNKRYFNSDNNVYSTIPAVILSQGNSRFVSQTLEWGRDTGVDAVLANYPMLVQNSQLVYSENPNEPKFGAKGARTFIASKGNTIYIGVISSATMGDSAQVLKAMGMENALNLDEGGSTAFWSGGYKAGPGRNIPNAILFIKR